MSVLIKFVILTMLLTNVWSLSVVRDLIQYNVVGLPVLHKTTSWEFDPDVGKRRSRQYQELNGHLGEKAIERLGLGIDGRDLERLEQQRKRDEGQLGASILAMDDKESSLLLTADSNTSFFSTDDDHDLVPWIKILEHLNEFYLNALKALFDEKCFLRESKTSVPVKGLRKEEFASTIAEIFGDDKFLNQAITMFNEIDKEEEGIITWAQFLDFAQKHLEPIATNTIDVNEGQIINCPHAKREAIIKIVSLETEQYFCYAIISKHGCIGLYDGNINFLTSYTALMTREDIDRTDEERRRKVRWITDAIFIAEVLMFVITNNARSIVIYDASNLHHIPVWLILGIPNVLHCLTYCFNTHPYILYAGNECGEIISFHFLQSSISLLRKKHNDKLTLFYWQELRYEKDFVLIKSCGKFFSESVKHIQYFTDNNTVVACSRDATNSLIIKFIDNRIKPYVFKIKRGVNCFYISKKLKILVTGSEDSALRIWNIYLTSNPIITLRSHKFGIIDVVIIESEKVLLSISRDGALKLWNLTEYMCIKSISIKFPSFKEMGKIIEWGKQCIFPGPKRMLSESTTEVESSKKDKWARSNILVSCCNYISCIRLYFLDGKDRNLDSSVLPAPPLQNSVLIPASWKISDENVDFKIDYTDVDSKTQKYIESLNFILKKDFLSDDNLNSEINFKIARLENKKHKMKGVVAQGAPYLALDLAEIEEIKLSPNLPVLDSKKIRQLVEKTEKMLSDAGARSLVFSSPSSSSRSKSSRTSSNRAISLKEDVEDATLTLFKQLADKLNLEQNVCTQAWNSYQQIRPKFDLEGDELHWLGCAIFVACRNTMTPTVGQSVLEGNCISLTSLLRHSNLSLMQFFNKIKRWAEMIKTTEDFHKKIDTLQSKVAVAFNIFQKYWPAFMEVFNPLTDIDTKQHRNRRQRPQPCTTTQLFEFCWLLFITVKTEDDSYSKDLVMSHHLLHACCDLLFQNAFLDARKDLLNPNFRCLPEDWSNVDYVLPEEAPCTISTFYKEDVKDAIYVKKYKFHDIISSLFERRVLQGDSARFTGLLNPSVFDANYNGLKKTYEAHLLTKGDFDERILLAEFRRQRKLKEQASLVENLESANPVEGSRQAPITPLTGRRFLGPKRTSDLNSSIAHNIMCLQNLIANRPLSPSEELRAIFKSCEPDPTESIHNILSQLQAKYCEKSSHLSDINATEVNHRATLTLKLAYKFLENILKSEKKRIPDLSFLMQKDSFFNSLYACSLEIVEYSHNTHNSPREFPWVLNALELTVYDFVKVIEITIRSDDQLPRYIVKHLSWVEERILESLMWEEDSALWKTINQSGEDIPMFEDIALPGYMKYGSTQNDPIQVQPVIPNTDSPGPSATETFQSPNINNANAPNIVNSQVKKNLFPTIKPGQSVLQSNKLTHMVLIDDGKYVKIVDSPNSEQIVAAATPVTDAKPKKGGSLCIIFRKFYNLAGVRMDHLCSKLGITAMDLQCKIWTVFEYSVRYTDLMKNRHLDQILMCAVYVICKVTGRTYQFTDIMKQYRDQPQANSDIYRNVLIKEDATPSRSDLIQFYNKVYVTKIREFALKFSNQGTNLPLSPLPVVKPLIASPKTEIQKNIFIKPYDSPTKVFNSGRIMQYCFNRSTSEDLRDINNTINTNGKRLLDNYDADLLSRPTNKKVAALIKDRERVQDLDAE
ncbi:hypothetical protein Trydic_g4544 [Trypoxylus dichotomus]